MINMNIDSMIDYLSDDESDSEMPAGCVSISRKRLSLCTRQRFSLKNLNVSNPVRQVICQMLDNYLSEGKSNEEIEFPSSLFCHERVFVRQQAQQRNLICRTLGYEELMRTMSEILQKTFSDVVHHVQSPFRNHRMS